MGDGNRDAQLDATLVENFSVSNERGFRCIEVVLRGLPQNGLLFKKAGRPFKGRPVAFIMWFSWQDRPRQ